MIDTIVRDDLSPDETSLVEEVSLKVVGEADKLSLSRCNFFVFFRYNILKHELERRGPTFNPRIEGDDRNPFDQHYWLAFDLGPSGSRTVLIDPLFGYIGLEESTKNVMDEAHLGYYKRKRVIPSPAEVRMKTIAI